MSKKKKAKTKKTELTLWNSNSQCGLPCRSFEECINQAVEFNCCEKETQYFAIIKDGRIKYSITVKDGDVGWVIHERIDA